MNKTYKTSFDIEKNIKVFKETVEKVLNKKFDKIIYVNSYDDQQYAKDLHIEFMDAGV